MKSFHALMAYLPSVRHMLVTTHTRLFSRGLQTRHVLNTHWKTPQGRPNARRYQLRSSKGDFSQGPAESESSAKSADEPHDSFTATLPTGSLLRVINFPNQAPGVHLYHPGLLLLQGPREEASRM